jgi:transcriptional regulator with XRE-family HTH domain
MAEEAEKIGERMRERRTELGLTQRECGERMPGSVQASEWSRWERGLHRSEQLDDVASALETTVADLVAGPLAERTEPEGNDLLGRLGGKKKDADALSRIESALEDLAVGQAELHEKLDGLIAAQAPARKQGADGG